MTWETLLWKLGIASRKKVQEDIRSLQKMIEEERRRVGKLYRVALGQKLRADDPDFSEEFNELPIFPYGNDSARPR